MQARGETDFLDLIQGLDQERSGGNNVLSSFGFEMYFDSKHFVSILLHLLLGVVLWRGYLNLLIIFHAATSPFIKRNKD